MGMAEARKEARMKIAITLRTIIYDLNVVQNRLTTALVDVLNDGNDVAPLWEARDLMMRVIKDISRVIDEIRALKG